MHLVVALLSVVLSQSATPEIDPRIHILEQAYPDAISKIDENTVVMQDGTELSFSEDSLTELNTDIASTIVFDYPLTFSASDIPENDAGRKRNQNFLMALYGNTADDVENNLTDVIWIPDYKAEIIRMNTQNGAAAALEAVSNELNHKPELWKYLSPAAGGFNWRFISGTDRLSAHSFGIAIDINIHYSHYWKWDFPHASESGKLDAKYGYKNLIPMEVVEVFEKHGFVWGGKWTHYDSMHFEYRPEIILAARYKMQKEEIKAQLKSKNSQLIEFINQSLHSFGSF